MRGRRWTALGCTALALLLVSPVGAMLGVPVGGIGFEVTQLGSSFAALFPGAIAAGPPASGTIISVALSLDAPGMAALSQYAQDVSTPGSSVYRHFLSADQVTSQFAPSEGQFRSVEDYFSSYGLHTIPSGNRLILGVEGSPSGMGAAFHTSFDEFHLAEGGGTYYGPSAAPTVPASLGISAATGFTNADTASPSVLQPLIPSSPSSTPCPTSFETQSGPITTFTPDEIQDAYGINDLLSAGDTGKGMTIGIVDAYDSAETQSSLSDDIASFSSDCGLPNANLNYEYPESFYTEYNSSPSDGWGGEEVLDMEWAHAIAPGATLDMSFAATSEDAWLFIAVDYLITEDIVNAISMSWGEPDVLIDSSGVYAVGHALFEAAAAEGISVFSSSGDCGASGGTKTVSTMYPASDLYVTGVGATNLTLSDGAYGSESAWSGNGSSTCAGNNSGGSGGGWAPTPQPWYQHGPGVSERGLRGVPDVAIAGGAATPVDVVMGGSFGAEYGTSAASPQWGGLAALVDQEVGGDVGLLNPAIYAILQSPAYTSYFHEITSGNNGYRAGPGWNPVTGVGTPIANVLIPALANGVFLTSPGNLSVTLSATSSGSTYAFTAVATGGTGGYLYSFNFGDDNGTTSTSPTASWTYRQTGTYFANVVVYDSAGNASVSPFVAANVGTTNLVVSLTANRTTLVAGQSLNLTAIPSGGGTPVYFYDFYFGDGSSTGIWWYNGDADSDTVANHTYSLPGTYDAQVIEVDSAGVADGGASAILPITVTPAVVLSPTISSVTLSSNPAPPNRTMYINVTAAGGATPYTYAFGGLPPGCSNANVSSLACAPSKNGSYAITVHVTSPGGSSASRMTVLTVGSGAVAPLTITQFTASPSIVNESQTTTLSVLVSGGTPPYSYSYSGLPPGCAAGSSPTFTCTPSASGTYTINVTVSDQLDRQVQDSVVLKVRAPNTTGSKDLVLVLGLILVGIGIVAIVILASTRRPKKTAPAGLPPGVIVYPSPYAIPAMTPPPPPSPDPVGSVSSGSMGSGLLPPPPPLDASPPTGLPGATSPASTTGPCRYCGSTLEPMAAFCHMCGKPVESST